MKITSDNEIVAVLVRRDGMRVHTAIAAVEEARDRILAGEDPQDVLEEEFGLEPDYIFSLI